MKARPTHLAVKLRTPTFSFESFRSCIIELNWASACNSQLGLGSKGACELHCKYINSADILCTRIVETHLSAR